jgi:hypothetical protein
LSCRGGVQGNTMEQLFGVAIINVVYHSTLATLTLIILFFRKFDFLFIFQIANFVRENIECSKIFLFSEMKNFKFN